MAALSCYWFGWSFLWLPLLIVIIPIQAEQLAGDASKGATLGSVLILGSVVSVLTAPLMGSYSDSSTHPQGRRRPFMVVGGVLASVALLLLAAAPSLELFSLAFAALSLANNLIIAPYSALVPDLIPLEQRGMASGYLGLFSMIGNLLGGAVGSLQSTIGLPAIYVILLTVHAASMAVTVRFVHEEPLALHSPVSPSLAAHHYTGGGGPLGRRPPTGCSRVLSLVRPFLSHDFRVVFFTRFVMQLGVLTVQEFIMYYLDDEVAESSVDYPGERVFKGFGRVLARSKDQAVTLLFGPVLVGAIVSSLVSGLLSDAMGGRRKRLIYISGSIMSVAALLFAVTRSFSVDLVLGALFGIGLGSFNVLDWALATDVLPDPEQIAKSVDGAAWCAHHCRSAAAHATRQPSAHAHRVHPDDHAAPRAVSGAEHCSPHAVDATRAARSSERSSLRSHSLCAVGRCVRRTWACGRWRWWSLRCSRRRSRAQCWTRAGERVCSPWATASSSCWPPPTSRWERSSSARWKGSTERAGRRNAGGGVDAALRQRKAGQHEEGSMHTASTLNRCTAYTKSRQTIFLFGHRSVCTATIDAAKYGTGTA